MNSIVRNAMLVAAGALISVPVSVMGIASAHSSDDGTKAAVCKVADTRDDVVKAKPATHVRATATAKQKQSQDTEVENSVANSNTTAVSQTSTSTNTNNNIDFPFLP